MTLKSFLLGSVTILFIATAGAQTVRPMHTRDVTRLSQLQITEYLKRKDVIFVAVGATESQGSSPSDREYIAPLGSAAQMAEEADAVYMPNLAYFYPGSTITSSATVYISIPLGEAYLKAIAHSLLRQGFKTQIWVWHGHGPAPLYVGAMVRDFFEETHVPILSIDGAAAERAYKGEKDKITYAKYAMVGHLEDVPLASEVPQRTAGRGGAGAEDPGLGILTKMGLAGSLALGYWWADPEAHSAGMGGGKLPATAEEREAWAKIGKQQLAAIVKTMDLKNMIAGLQQHVKFTEDNIVPKFKSMLPESQK
ncbi:MAG TPA: creatininase family protein [Bryobacteraceae bacterium]|nr:creatininase family protein [Bryobacteraceae bacterium]